MKIQSKDLELLTGGTSEERVNFFNPHLMKEKEFPYRFGIWCGFYGDGADFPWSWAPIHYEWFAWFGAMIYSDEQRIVKLKLTTRDICKTYFMKREMAYLHLYNLSEFTYFVSAQLPKVKEEIEATSKILKSRSVVADYGAVLLNDKKEEIVFKPVGNSEHAQGSKIAGSTATSFPRGITHNDYKPHWLFIDDMETRQTLRSPADTHANYQKYQSDILSSMDNRRSRVSIIGNNISIHGNHQKLYEGLEEEDRMIAPLYDPATDTPVWPSRFCWDPEEALRDGKVSITALRDEYLKQPGGDKVFREDFLANPLSYEELYYDIRKIEGVYKPVTEPLRTHTDGVLAYRVYREYDPTKQYCVGVDPAEGIGLDDTAFVLIAYDAAHAEIVVTANSNKVKQAEFCASNLRFNALYGCRPFITPEYNMGAVYVDHLAKNYPRELIFKRERVGQPVSQELGLLRNQLTSRQLLAETLKSALESGSLVNLCPILHAELCSYTALDHTQSFRRVTPETYTTNHRDLLSAAQNAVYGLRQASESAALRGKEPSLSDQDWFRNTPSTIERITGGLRRSV